MMTSILTGWQLAFSNKYCRSSKILTKTTFKALFSTQTLRIYVIIEKYVKKIVSRYLFPSCELTYPRDEVFFIHPLYIFWC